MAIDQKEINTMELNESEYSFETSDRVYRAVMNRPLYERLEEVECVRETYHGCAFANYHTIADHMVVALAVQTNNFETKH